MILFGNRLLFTHTFKREERMGASLNNKLQESDGVETLSDDKDYVY